MRLKTTRLLKAGLSALHYSGASVLMAPFTKGAGVVFMLHHVRPEPPQAFEPNRILKITPKFLEAVIREVMDAGFDVVSLDEVARRLTEGGGERPFASFTFDDGYRDNRDYAYPIFKRYGFPFAIYVPGEFGDGKGDLWWLALEAVLRAAPRISLEMNGDMCHFELATPADKDHAFHVIYWWLRTMPDKALRAVVARLARDTGQDLSKLCAELVMSWQEIRELAKDPLVTIGAHTCHHAALAKLPAAEARAEIADSVKRVEAELGRPCRHFSYPYGDDTSAGEREFAMAKDLGLLTAVTTRKGLIQPQHKDAPTALPRVSLNGDFQDIRYVRVMLTGAPFAFWNGLRRVPTTAAAT
jgi:peptidoglycan/xylan/chitin deacetylase (PgdA/CDA1 family)